MPEQPVIFQTNVNPSDPNGTERRFALLNRHRELAEHFVSQSADKDVVVLIWDANEYPMMPGLTPEFITQVNEDGCIPATVIGMSRWQAYKFLRRFQKELHKVDGRDPKVSKIVEMLANPAPAGTFNVMVVSRGKQLAQWPIV